MYTLRILYLCFMYSNAEFTSSVLYFVFSAHLISCSEPAASRVDPAGSQLEEIMNKHSLLLAVAALALGVAVSSSSASAQNGPGGAYFGAASGPQSGGQPVAAQKTPTGRSIYDSAPPAADSQGPAGPAGANFGATSGPQTGNKPFAATTQSRSASNGPTTITPGSAGPAGNNYGAASGPQGGR
jgi:hypothetical protein